VKLLFTVSLYPAVVLVLSVTFIPAHAQIAQKLNRGNASYEDAVGYKASGDWFNAAESFLEVVTKDRKGKYPNALAEARTCANNHAQQVLNNGREEYLRTGNTSVLHHAYNETGEYCKDYESRFDKAAESAGRNSRPSLARINGIMNAASSSVFDKIDMSGYFQMIQNEECGIARAYAGRAETAFVALKYHDAYFNALDAQSGGCDDLRLSPRLEQIKSESILKGIRRLMIIPMSVTDMNQEPVTELPHAIGDTILSYNDPFYSLISRSDLENKLFESNISIEQLQRADINQMTSLAKVINMRYLLVMKVATVSVSTPQINRKSERAYLIHGQRAENENGTMSTFYRATQPVEYAIATGHRVSTIKIQVRLIDTEKKQILFSDFKEAILKEEVKFVDVGGYSIDDLSHIRYDELNVAGVRMPLFKGIVEFQQRLHDQNKGRHDFASNDVVYHSLVSRLASDVVHDVIVKKID
jgi:hypothetical protein